MVVYVDLAFVINFCIDAALLYTTAALLKTPRKILRITLGAGLGAFYAVLSLFPGFEGLASLPGKLLAALLMIVFAMGTFREFTNVTGIRKILIRFLGFLGISAASGGVLFAMQSLLTPTSTVLGQLALVRHQVVWWTSLDTVLWSVLFPVGMAVAVTSLRQVKRFWHMHSLFLQVVFGIDQRQEVFRVLVDSGNVLKDPLTHDPVAIVKMTAAKSLLPDTVYRVLSGQKDPYQALVTIGDTDPDFATRMRVIPYQGIGGKSGHMLGIRLNVASPLAAAPVNSLLPLVVAFARDDQFPASDFDGILPAASVRTEKEGTDTDASITATSHQTVHSSHPA